MKSTYFLKDAVRESFDNLPSGLCFFARSGIPVLCNHQMQRLVFALTDSDIQSLDELKKKLSEMSRKPEYGLKDDTFSVSDGSIWKFSFTDIVDETGTAFTQVLATNITELWNASAELEKSNARLREMSGNLKQMSRNMAGIAREEEILAMKMRIHNGVGTSVLNTRRYYLEGPSPDKKAELVSMWKKTLYMLHNEIGKDDVTDPFAELTEVASSIGAEIVKNGDMPDDRTAVYLITLAIRECLTNTIRHAGGNKVYVLLTHDLQTAKAVITNDGRPPQVKISEGGGLSALRKRIEKAGGTMHTESFPVFALTVTLPLKGDERP